MGNKTKYVKKVLMCRPDHFSVEYVINPWMIPGSVDQRRAGEQWHELVRTYERLGISVSVIPQHSKLPDMVFSADQGVVTGSRVLMSNFKYPERRGERDPYQSWFQDSGYELQFLPDDHYFEGTGECLFWNDMLFVGIGFRTKPSSCPLLAETLGVEVVPLELVNPQFYHLDTCFLPLNAHTAFYYPEAFTLESQAVMRRYIPTLLPLTHEEAYGFCANSVVTDHHIVMQKGNPSFRSQLRDLGYTVVEAEVGEFIKAGGGIHCLTNVISEEYS